MGEDNGVIAVNNQQIQSHPIASSSPSRIDDQNEKESDGEKEENGER